MDGSAVEGFAVDGFAVEGFAVEGSAVEGFAADGFVVEGFAVGGQDFLAHVAGRPEAIFVPVVADAEQGVASADLVTREIDTALEGVAVGLAAADKRNDTFSGIPSRLLRDLHTLAQLHSFSGS